MERKSSKNNDEVERRESQPFRFLIQFFSSSGKIINFDPGRRRRQQEKLQTTHDLKKNLFCLEVFVFVFLNQILH